MRVAFDFDEFEAAVAEKIGPGTRGRYVIIYRSAKPLFGSSGMGLAAIRKDHSRDIA